ncbi:creatininase [Comamonas serinivorans]|uniref:Creatininase n=1 Tax=Comamonas serinivorans TaxID=1082851 RepID=A0A1Y0ER10_9BURK|nr:creatininase family protein [Comamonas serinivorans]ARU06016.1 creatininase [Comamonas serinivorans]
MSISRFLWADHTQTDLAQRDLSQAVAVLPVAAIEQHGPHLPLSVDADLADGIVAACCTQLTAASAAPPPVLFLPTQRVGYSPEHVGFAGTLTLKASTVMALWTDIAESVQASGVRRIVLFNTHGGNVGLMDVVARDWRTRLGMLAVSLSWFNLPLRDASGADVNARFPAHEHRFGVHAGQVETAMMRALRPELVHMDRAQAFPSVTEQRAAQCPLFGDGRSAKLAWHMADLNPQGAAGNAAAATAEDGQAVVLAAGRALAQLLGEIAAWPVPGPELPRVP